MEVLKGWLARLAIYLMACLPLRMSHWIGERIGRFMLSSHSQMAKITEENLRLCLPELDPKRRRQLVQKSLVETGKTMAETGAIWKRSYNRWLRPKVVSNNGEELLLNKVGDRKGVILLAPHLGNWEVLGLKLSELTQVTSLYQPPELAALENLIRQAREKAGARLVPTNKSGVAALLKALRRGELVAILPDQVPDHRSGGAFAPFFGQPALTMTLVHNLIVRTGCGVLIAYAKRVKGGFEIVYHEVDSGVYSKDDAIALAAMNSSVERCVREVPEQYQWEYKRFKRRPQGLEKCYKF